MTSLPRILAALTLALWLALLPCPGASAQPPDLANRPVSEIKIQGLAKVNATLVTNQIRLKSGDPYDARVVQDDIVRITHLGRFGSVTARVEPRADGSVALIYVVQELPLLADVQVVGNKEVSDQKLLQLAVLRAGDPVDPFLIQRAIRQMQKEYELQGYFEADISDDKKVLDDSGVLIFKVREGPLATIRGIKFEGNEVYSSDELRGHIKSTTYFPIFRKGEVNREQLEADAARLRDFHRDRGYLDAQVGRRIELSPNQKDAVVVFVISEGRQFTVDQIKIEGNQLFSQDQIRQAMVLKAGDVFTAERLRDTLRAVTDLYGKLGFIEATIRIDRLFHEREPKVDLRVTVDEGHPYVVGKVTVVGNYNTQDKVVLREVRGMRPGRRFDRAGIELTEQRLRESPLFTDAKVSIQGTPEELTRDVVVEVKEGQTGSLSFGAGISSDAGVIGAIDVIQRNFDIADTPESIGELFTAKAFRGAGQYFSLNLQPGNEFSRYSISFREPYLFESDFFFDTSLFYFTRDREKYNEERIGGGVGIGQRFGDIWSGAVRLRAEQLSISDIEVDAPVDVFAVAGSSLITSAGFTLVRDTSDSRIFPTRGSRTELGIVRAGVLGGDYDFTAATIDFRKFWTVDEDFFGYKTIVSLRSEIGYIFEGDQAPVFERFYAGGHRTFRGYRFRGVGPRGIRSDTLTLGDDPVGGDWLFLLGLEYNFPIYQDIFRGVIFTDTGTVQKDLGFDEYRVSIGAGIRLKIPFLGQAPFALDFAVPIVSQEGDEEQIFSFDLALPFQ